MIRINKYLSMCGVASRRAAESLIDEKRVSLNGNTIEKQGVLVDAENDVVRVDGEIVSPVADKIYIVLNKPAEVMTTLHDPFRRKTVKSFLKKVPQRVYPVGRLDFDTEGVLLLTNDGELTYRLAHPKFQIRRIYVAHVQGHFTPEDSDQLVTGVPLEDGNIGRAKEVSILEYEKSTRIRLVLTEGRKREVKQLCRAVGHQVEHLVRTEFAGVRLKGLRPGHWRPLSKQEVATLKELTNTPPD
jgi:23S rRNA pseudouridine2605 synthase